MLGGIKITLSNTDRLDEIVAKLVHQKNPHSTTDPITKLKLVYCGHHETDASFFYPDVLYMYCDTGRINIGTYGSQAQRPELGCSRSLKSLVTDHGLALSRTISHRAASAVRHSQGPAPCAATWAQEDYR